MSRSRWLMPILVSNTLALLSAVAGVVIGEWTFQIFRQKAIYLNSMKALSAIYDEIARHHIRTLSRLIVSNARDVTLVALLKAKLTPQFASKDWFGATGSRQVVLGTSQMDLLIRNFGYDIDDLQDKKWTADQRDKKFDDIISRLLFIANLAFSSCIRIENFLSAREFIEGPHMLRAWHFSADNFDKEVDLIHINVTADLTLMMCHRYLQGDGDAAGVEKIKSLFL